MRMLMLIVVWVTCILVGGAVGFFAGWALWKLGFELIGSAVAMVGAAIGGIVIFLWLMSSDFGRRWI